MITCDNGRITFTGTLEDICFDFVKIGVVLWKTLAKRYGQPMAETILAQAMEVINVACADEEDTDA